MRYHVLHDTHYRYGAPVSFSRHVMHLSPRVCDWQDVHRATLEVTPAPTTIQAGKDVFGNPETRIEIHRSHDELLVRSQVDLSVVARPWAAGAEDGPGWESVQAALRPEGGAPTESRRFLCASAHVPVQYELADFARPFFPPERPLLAATIALMTGIHRGFRYDRQSTTVDTSVLEVLSRRCGVCQDFAHLGIACLRSLGLAARYVSGYLCTRPPPGQPRLAGADASHAWLAVWCPGVGWVELDPTNDCRADQRHIVLGWGRDFADVSPLRGVIQGGAAQALAVQVTVTPVLEPRLRAES